jgi:exopolyphosphatase/guanosine-5'-triphosphate,3'-diphosphate pyrophosphatase
LKKLDIDFSDVVLVQQLVALRLAVMLCHARRDPDVKGLEFQFPTTRPQTIQLKYQAEWASNYPQSAYLLREEALAWQKSPWALVLEEV